MSSISGARVPARVLPIAITVNVDGQATAIDRIVERVRAGLGFCFYTLNLDHLSSLPRNAEFRAAYRAAELVSADGWPIVWLMGRQGVDVVRTTGSDLIEPICAAAAREGFGVYFVGPGEASQTMAIATLRARHDGLKVLGAECPALSDGAGGDALAQLASRILGSGAKLCFLSLGSPKQELIAYRLRALCPGVGFIGVGAGMDFLSGLAVRAPVRMQRWRMEWLWRLANHPGRLAPRYWRCGTFFAGLLLRGAIDRDELAIVRGAETRLQPAIETK